MHLINLLKQFSIRLLLRVRMHSCLLYPGSILVTKLPQLQLREFRLCFETIFQFTGGLLNQFIGRFHQWWPNGPARESMQLRSQSFQH